MLKNSNDPYSFQPFTISDQFPLCGFDKYIVTAHLKENPDLGIEITNPHKSDECLTVSQCLTRSIDTSHEKIVTFNIEGKTKSGHSSTFASKSFDVEIVDCSESLSKVTLTNEIQTFQVKSYDQSSALKGQF